MATEAQRTEYDGVYSGILIVSDLLQSGLCRP